MSIPKNHRVLEHALKILDFIAASPSPPRFAEICESLGLAKSSAHTLLATLENLKYIQRDPASASYHIGLQSFEVGAKFLEKNDFYQGARDLLKELVEATGETAHLAILDGSDIVYMSKFDCAHTVRMVSFIGKRIPAHATALGKALLAAFSDSAIDALYAEYRFTQFTNKTIKNLGQLKKELAKIRLEGFAYDDEESSPGVECIALAIGPSPSGEPLGLSISIPQTRLDSGKNKFQKFQGPLQKTVQRMQAMLK